MVYNCARDCIAYLTDSFHGWTDMKLYRMDKWVEDGCGGGIGCKIGHICLCWNFQAVYILSLVVSIFFFYLTAGFA